MTYIVKLKWFNFVLGLNFIFFCFGVWYCTVMILKQKKIKFKPRIKLNHNIVILLTLRALLPWKRKLILRRDSIFFYTYCFCWDINFMNTNQANEALKYVFLASLKISNLIKWRMCSSGTSSTFESQVIFAIHTVYILCGPCAADLHVTVVEKVAFLCRWPKNLVPSSYHNVFFCYIDTCSKEENTVKYVKYCMLLYSLIISSMPNKRRCQFCNAK